MLRVFHNYPPPRGIAARGKSCYAEHTEDDVLKHFFSEESIVFSVLAGALAYLLSAAALMMLGGSIRIALWIALGTAFATPFLTPLIIASGERIYRGVEEEIAEPVLLRENVNLAGETGSRNGFLYVTGDALWFFSRDRQPHLSQRIGKKELYAVRQADAIHLQLFLSPEEFLEFVSADCGRILDCLTQNGLVAE